MTQTLALWVGFHVFVLAVLAVDLGIFHRRTRSIGFREALAWTIVWVTLAMAFAAGVWVYLGQERAINFVTGYIIEESLSVDNIFVFVLIFTYFGVPRPLQRRVLFWGILGAIIMRGTMIGAGAALLHRFEWVAYIFGAFLLLTGFRMAFQTEEHLDPQKNPVIRLASRYLPVTREYQGDAFLVRRGRWVAFTPLFLVLLAVETTDVVFAVDSIPAIFAVTTDTFIVYTSNIFAILGLRSLYFLLAGAMDKFRYLKPSLAAILIFVGAKMCSAKWIEVHTLVSLGVIVGILTIGITASFLAARRDGRRGGARGAERRSMNPEKLERRDIRLIAICAVVAAVSLFVGVRYFFLAFPESSIEFRTTREDSLPLARAFVSSAGLDPSGYRHASVFGFDDTAKVFLERELGVEESGRLLDSTVRLWRWEHRWFRPLQKEEIQVEVTTKGEIVGFDHLLPEEAPGADLPADEARRLAEGFLSGTMGRPLGTLSFVEGSLEKRPHRTDHTFTWKLTGSEVKGADYRIEVGVAGDRPARYLEYLKVPDTWQRDYATLRSKNEVAGQFDTVLMLLTAVAMLVILVQRIVRGDVRWRTAAVLGAVTSVLQLLSALNEIPADIYAYDTTTSFTGFLVQKLLGAFLSSLSFGAAIFLIAAAAETLYRTRFPRFLSVSSLLRPRALRTKEYFIASVVGITLTFFFFAYENVFYIIANRLGAWAPREIAYSDLLSTAFPWIYVLFIGWFPAISEEFVSRMFSIPFFERFLRIAGPLRLPLAMVVSAFIWGFGHAGYPNQPWFIRGLEVGLAGMVFGLVLMRFGILSVVICHFSVDALYTAFVLIRSPNPYYVISGTLSAGVFVILFIAALVAYLVKGGFAAEATNEAEGVAPEPPPAPREGPASAAAGAAMAGYRPLAGRTIAIGLVLAAAGSRCASRPSSGSAPGPISPRPGPRRSGPPRRSSPSAATTFRPCAAPRCRWTGSRNRAGPTRPTC